MASDINLSPSAVNAMANALDSLIDGGASAPTIEFHIGSQPADPTTGGTDTPIAMLDMNNGSPFGEAVAGVITANAIADDEDAHGDAAAVTWFRIRDGDGNGLLDGTVGVDSGYDINFAAVIWPNGSTVQVTSLAFTVPDGT